MRDGVEEACLATTCVLGLESTANQLLVLTDDLRFAGDKQVIGDVELAVLLLEQMRLRFPDIQRHHPHVEQTRGEQQRHGVEYAVDEQCLAQFERADRYLQCIGDERRERERSHQSPQQSPIAGEGCEYERDPVNRRDVEFHPGAEIHDHFGHREHDRENICKGNDAVRTRNGGDRLRFDAGNHFC